MNNILRLFALLVAVSLCCLNTGSKSYIAFSDPSHNINEKYSSPSLLTGTPDISGIQGSNKNITTRQANHFPAQKYHSGHLKAGMPYIGKELPRTGLQYFISGRKSCSLAIRNIIFPFHYFW